MAQRSLVIARFDATLRRVLVSFVALSAAIAPPIAIAARTTTTHPGVRIAPTLRSEVSRRHFGETRTDGVAHAHASIIGGAIAQAGTFPSLAYIVDFQGQAAYQCTGTVVAPSLVLTAGHCAENMQTGVPFSPSGYRVVIGDVDPLLPGETVSTVLGVIVYPGLSRKLDRGDAALLVLSTPTTAPPVTLGTLPFVKHLAGAPATIVGWGKTTYDQTALTEQLQSAVTVVQGRKWCRRNAPPFYPRSEICAVAPPSYDTGVCEGDSGGPLLASGPSGAPVEVGIADHVYGKCSTRQPSVFASVGALSSWIHTWIEAYQRAPTPPTPTPPVTLPPGPAPQPAPS
jgi:secreted trypsin-like serine protease